MKMIEISHYSVIKVLMFFFRLNKSKYSEHYVQCIMVWIDHSPKIVKIKSFTIHEEGLPLF